MNRKWKAISDEERAVGVVMHEKLKSGFVYTPSSRYIYQDPDDEMHSDETDKEESGKNDSNKVGLDKSS